MQPPKDGTEGIHERKELDGMAPLTSMLSLTKDDGRQNSKVCRCRAKERKGDLTFICWNNKHGRLTLLECFMRWGYILVIFMSFNYSVDHLPNYA